MPGGTTSCVNLTPPVRNRRILCPVRASRLVSLLLLLQTRGGMTAGELAEQLEVSVRTIYRDVDALSEAGIPIYADRGPHGGVRLVDGYRTRLTGLTEEEASGLFLSGLPGPAAELGLGTVVAAARLKVLAALPAELRGRASRINQRFHLDAPGWFQPAETHSHLQTLAEAVWQNRRIDVTYERGDRTVERTLDPLGLVLKGGVWYMVATAGGPPRTYRVSRIVLVALRDERFERPDDFDLSDFWSESIARYESSVDRLEVVLRVSPDRMDELAEAIGSAAMRTATPLDDIPDPDGWRRLRVRLDWPHEVPHQLIRLGDAAEVLEPAELRERLVELARRVLDRYRAVTV